MYGSEVDVLWGFVFHIVLCSSAAECVDFLPHLFTVNIIGDDGEKAVAEALRTNTRLIWLSCDGNGYCIAQSAIFT